ncbi:MAG: hypothetical protein J1F09_08265 [Oscillospiraceae bacterium]|nr:hypothetical protein [Oscillospiraceae bacterium]
MPVFGLCAAVFILVSGGIIKLVNIKLKWRSFKIYSNVLLIIGGLSAVANIIYAVVCAAFILSKPDGLPTAGVYYYGAFAVCLAMIAPLGIIGILLELIYRKKQKNVFKGFSVVLLTLDAEVLAATLAVIIWAAVSFF